MNSVTRTLLFVLATVLATGAFVAAAVADETGVEDVLENEVVFEPEYATQTEQGAYVRASASSDDELDLTIDVMRALTPEQISEALGGTDARPTGIVTPADQQLELVEVRATREQHEAVQSAIPLGLASIAWAMQNPAEAWRIVFPVSG